MALLLVIPFDAWKFPERSAAPLAPSKVRRRAIDYLAEWVGPRYAEFPEKRIFIAIAARSSAAGGKIERSQ